MKNNEDIIAINDDLLFLIAELIAARLLLEIGRKKISYQFYKKIDEYEETIDLGEFAVKLNEDYLKNLSFGSINFGSMILECSRILINHLDKENLQVFYHNINTLKILPYRLRLTEILSGGITVGKYNPNNSIQLAKKYIDSLPHELTHMSSTIVKDNGFILSGFHQVKGKKDYGYGVNEGYTQYFTEKYFLDSFPHMHKGYPAEVEIIKKLICIIGEKEMENLYFHANLSGLIDIISHYSSLDDAKDFIAAVDFVKLFFYKIPKSKRLLQMLEIKLQKINIILLKCFLQKQSEERKKGISSQELKMEQEEFDSYLGDEIIIKLPFKVKVNTFNIGIPLEVEESLRRRIK